MSRSSFAGNFGKVVLGGAAGFALYFLFGRGGLGFGESGDGEGRGEPRLPTEPPAVPPPSPPPTRPRDEARLNYVLSSAGLEQRDANWKPPAVKKIYALEEVIARIKDGGRSDVTLKVSGDAREGTLRDVLAGLKQAGIDVYRLEATPPAPPSVSGNARGEYGGRHRGGGA